MYRNRTPWEVILESIQKLYVLGSAIDWRGFDKDYRRQRLALPSYPFERERYWLPLPKVQDTQKIPTSTPHSPPAKKLPQLIPIVANQNQAANANGNSYHEQNQGFVSSENGKSYQELITEQIQNIISLIEIEMQKIKSKSHEFKVVSAPVSQELSNQTTQKAIVVADNQLISPLASNVVNIQEVIVSKIFSLVAEVSQISINKLQLENRFNEDLGFESLMVAELKTKVITAFPEIDNIPQKLFFKSETINHLIDFIFQSLTKDPTNAIVKQQVVQPLFEISKALTKFRVWEKEFEHGQIFRIDKKFAHKHQEQNVLVARLEKLQDDVIVGEIVQDAHHPFFYEHPKDHVPGMYVIEAARQFSTILGHAYYSVPMDAGYILDELQSQFHKFIEHDQPLFAITKVYDHVYVKGQLIQMYTDCFFVQNQEIVAVIKGQYRMFDASKYHKIREKKCNPLQLFK